MSENYYVKFDDGREAELTGVTGIELDKTGVRIYFSELHTIMPPTTAFYPYGIPAVHIVRMIIIPKNAKEDEG